MELDQPFGTVDNSSAMPANGHAEEPMDSSFGTAQTGESDMVTLKMQLSADDVAVAPSSFDALQQTPQAEPVGVQFDGSTTDGDNTADAAALKMCANSLIADLDELNNIAQANNFSQSDSAVNGTAQDYDDFFTSTLFGPSEPQPAATGNNSGGDTTLPATQEAPAAEDTQPSEPMVDDSQNFMTMIMDKHELSHDYQLVDETEQFKDTTLNLKRLKAYYDRLRADNRYKRRKLTPVSEEKHAEFVVDDLIGSVERMECAVLRALDSSASKRRGRPLKNQWAKQGRAPKQRESWVPRAVSDDDESSVESEKEPRIWTKEPTPAEIIRDVVDDIVSEVALNARFFVRTVRVVKEYVMLECFDEGIMMSSEQIAEIDGGKFVLSAETMSDQLGVDKYMMDATLATGFSRRTFCTAIAGQDGSYNIPASMQPSLSLVKATLHPVQRRAPPRRQPATFVVRRGKLQQPAARRPTKQAPAARRGRQPSKPAAKRAPKRKLSSSEEESSEESDDSDEESEEESEEEERPKAKRGRKPKAVPAKTPPKRTPAPKKAPEPVKTPLVAAKLLRKAMLSVKQEPGVKKTPAKTQSTSANKPGRPKKTNDEQVSISVVKTPGSRWQIESPAPANQTAAYSDLDKFPKVMVKASKEFMGSEIAVGAEIFAKWPEDGSFYPGRISHKVGKIGWHVDYHDGTDRVVPQKEIVKLKMLPIGQTVSCSLGTDGYYEYGVVRGHFRNTVDKTIGYTVELDDGTTQRFDKSEVVLGKDQGEMLLRAQAMGLDISIPTKDKLPSEDELDDIEVPNYSVNKSRRGGGAGSRPTPVVPVAISRRTIIPPPAYRGGSGYGQPASDLIEPMSSKSPGYYPVSRTPAPKRKRGDYSSDDDFYDHKSKTPRKGGRYGDSDEGDYGWSGSGRKQPTPAGRGRGRGGKRPYDEADSDEDDRRPLAKPASAGRGRPRKSAATTFEVNGTTLKTIIPTSSQRGRGGRSAAATAMAKFAAMDDYSDAESPKPQVSIRTVAARKLPPPAPAYATKIVTAPVAKPASARRGGRAVKPTKPFSPDQKPPKARGGYADTSTEEMILPDSSGRGRPASAKAVKQEIIFDDPNDLGPILSGGSTIFAGMTFLLTAATKTKDDDSHPTIHLPFNKNHLKLQIKSGQGQVLDKFEPHDRLGQCFLLSETHTRTVKYIQCLASGIPCVSHRWIRDCCKYNRLMPYSNYLLPAGYSLESDSVVPWHGKQSILSNMNVMLFSQKNRNFEFIWSPVVMAANARVIARTLVNPAVCNIDFLKDVSVVVTDMSCPHSVLTRAKGMKIPVVSSEWLIQCLIHGKKLGFHSHEKYKYDCSLD